ncbi:hypothetical protein N7468_004174 [Penicillium chermesinum]|uniref:Uncharacterized protein n=1 Tax=Penicillium chermesinum TaxID=63820 RepID=A0A9W9P804_9EURO|nr:uncharacterized protein N7468_004174 [Penicillium chermesinum]KAJ5239555.1 hypothetical protein N7468_004174 [Penicillium chermesinum]
MEEPDVESRKSAFLHQWSRIRETLSEGQRQKLEEFGLATDEDIRSQSSALSLPLHESQELRDTVESVFKKGAYLQIVALLTVEASQKVLLRLPFATFVRSAIHNTPCVSIYDLYKEPCEQFHSKGETNQQLHAKFLEVLQPYRPDPFLSTALESPPIHR